MIKYTCDLCDEEKDRYKFKLLKGKNYISLFLNDESSYIFEHFNYLDICSKCWSSISPFIRNLIYISKSELLLDAIKCIEDYKKNHRK